MRAVFERTMQDLRYAVRGWRRTPGFTIAAVATLALGIGANTAMFTVVSGVLLRPLPFPDPERVVQLSVSNPSDHRLPPTFVFVADLESWRQSASSIERAATYSAFSQNLQGIAVPEQVATVRADRTFFPTLGARPLLGRTFDQTDPPNVVVSSFGFWQRHLNGDAAALGKAITLDGEAFTVIGVMPRAFEFPYRAVRTDLWTVWDPPSARERRLEVVVARLTPGVSVDRARSELSVISARLALGRQVNVTQIDEVVGGPVRNSLLVLLGAVGLVLLVACANVANLLLARAAARSREVAVRMALGANRSHLVRQFLTESVLLALVGGVVGVAVGIWATRVLLEVASRQLPRAWDIGFDWRVFVFLLAACLVTGVAFGLAPALGAARTDVQRDLKSGERGSAGRGRLRDTLVVAEIALAFVLLVGAGLLLRTFLNLRGTPTGFEAGSLLTMHVVVADAAEEAALEQRVAQVPGVQSAGFISLLPLQNSNWNGRFTIKGRPEEGGAEFRYVSPRYFETMGIPLKRGRWLAESDTSSTPKVVLVNDAFAARYVPGEDPVGRELTGRGVIVGVVGDVHQLTLDRAAVPEIYYPIAQNFAQLRSVGSSLVVRAAGAVREPPLHLVDSIRHAIREVNPNQATFRVATMEQVIGESMGSQRLNAWLLTVFAAIGTLLASAGVYGVMAYVVTLRTRELGVRIALGADGGRILGLVLRRGLMLTAAGVAIGCGGALGLVQLLKSYLYGVTPTDPATFGAIGVLLALVALAACVIPARRAMRIDPAVTLKTE